MGTELTAKLEELWDAFNSILKHGGPPTTGDIEAFTKSFNETVAISQQPPVYAMCACGDKIMPNSDAVCGNCAAAPSPQAVTVDGKWISVKGLAKEVETWYLGLSDTPHRDRVLVLNDDASSYELSADERSRLRTRLDQYLNNR